MLATIYTSPETGNKKSIRRNIISEMLHTMTSQPFDKDLHHYKKSLIPDDKIGFDKQPGESIPVLSIPLLPIADLNPSTLKLLFKIRWIHHDQ